MGKKPTTYNILIIGGLLILFGILAVYSVSIHESFTTSLRFDTAEPTNYFYFFRHIRNLVVGLVM